MTPPFIAAVFDMDGTLVDNMRFHADAWLAMCERLHVSFPSRAAALERFEVHYAGKKNEEIFPDLLGRPLPADELTRLAADKERLYRELAAPDLRFVAGVPAFLDRLANGKVRRAVATAAPPENRALVLDGLTYAGRPLRAAFEQVVGAEHAKRGKPAPDLYLAAAALLELPPSSCIAFEDAPNGVKAAVAAGMRCVGVLTTTTAEALADAGAFCTLSTFEALPPALTALLP